MHFALEQSIFWISDNTCLLHKIDDDVERAPDGFWSNTEATTELRSCVNRMMGMGSHSLFHSFLRPLVPDKLYGFCGRQAPRNKKSQCQRSGAVRTGWALIPYSTLSSVPLSLINCMVSVSSTKKQEVSVSEVRSCANRWARALIPYSTLPGFVPNKP